MTSLDDIKSEIQKINFDGYRLIQLAQSLAYPDDDSEFEQDGDFIEISDVIQQDMSFRQSKEIFSRLKFNAVEGETKLKFLRLLYGEAHIPPNYDLSSVFKDQLVKKKDELEATKTSVQSLIQDTLKAYNDVIDEKAMIEQELDDLQKIEEEIQELTRLDIPMVKRTMEECQVVFDSQALAIEGLSRTLTGQAQLIQEAEFRLTREQAHLLELDAQISTLTTQLLRQQRDTEIRDQTSKELFKYYEQYSKLLSGLFGIKLDFVAPPLKLLDECLAVIQATFDFSPDIVYSLYFNKTGSLAQVKTGDSLMRPDSLQRLQSHFQETGSLYSLVLSLQREAAPIE